MCEKKLQLNIDNERSDVTVLCKLHQTCWHLNSIFCENISKTEA